MIFLDIFRGFNAFLMFAEPDFGPINCFLCSVISIFYNFFI